MFRIARSILSVELARLAEALHGVSAASAHWIPFEARDKHGARDQRIGSLVAQVIKPRGGRSGASTVSPELRRVVSPVDAMARASASGTLNRTWYCDLQPPGR